jgi:hypothetical protein
LRIEACGYPTSAMTSIAQPTICALLADCLNVGDRSSSDRTI